jgi:hypothetical protein
MSGEGSAGAASRVAVICKQSISYRCPSGNSPMPLCCTFVTLLGAHPRPGALTMSRTFRTLALSAALLAATTSSAFADMPGGTNPPPKGMIVTTVDAITSFLSFLGL